MRGLLCVSLRATDSLESRLLQETSTSFVLENPALLPDPETYRGDPALCPSLARTAWAIFHLILFFFSFFFFFFLISFFHLHLQHVEAPRLGVESELLLPAYATAYPPSSKLPL